MTPPIQRARLNRPPFGVWLLLASVLAGVLVPGSAAASGRAGLVVVPRPASEPALSYFKLTGRPGSVLRAGQIQLRNPTAKRLRVAITPVDGMTLSTLGSGYAPPGSPMHGSTPWLLIGAHLLTLRPHTSLAFPVFVRVPRTAPAGDHLSGVSIEALDQGSGASVGKGVSVASVDRYAIGVETSIPGRPTPLIRFTGANITRQPAGLTFQLLASNLGNVILPGVNGHVLITQAGHTVLSRQIPAGTFVTNTNIAYPATAFEQVPAQGTTYHITAYLRYRGGIARLNTDVSFGEQQAALQQLYGRHPVTAARTGTAWWKIAGIILVCLYAVTLTVVLLRKRRQQAAPAA